LDYLDNVSSEGVSAIASALLEIFESHLKDDRITLPLLEVFDVLFSANVFMDLEGVELVSFAKRLYHLVFKELFKSRDPKKLQGGVKL
jgi:hypothetical protein